MTDAEDRREAELRKLAGHTSEFAFLLRRLDEVRERARAVEDERSMLSAQMIAAAVKLAEAEARLDDLLHDAARYRWCRENITCFYIGESNIDLNPQTPEMFDSIVDHLSHESDDETTRERGDG